VCAAAHTATRFVVFIVVIVVVVVVEHIRNIPLHELSSPELSVAV
jgi:hypothetical protein